jgi:hypothetical protein
MPTYLSEIEHAVTESIALMWKNFAQFRADMLKI